MYQIKRFILLCRALSVFAISIAGLGLSAATAATEVTGEEKLERGLSLVRTPVGHGVRAESVVDFGALVPERPASSEAPTAVRLERISTVVPWPRGIVAFGEKVIVLARGRHRSGGGVPTEFDDQGGNLFLLDPQVSEPVIPGETAGEAVRRNGRVLAQATRPPFYPHDFADPPEENTRMTRPYCGLNFDPVSRNIILCAFSGAELDGGRRFRKHATDSLLRFDLRDQQWRIIDQHDPESVPEDALGGAISNEYYPHHDPRENAPPHGWLNGPTGCTVVGRYLYAASKDNHLVVQYDLDEIRENPEAGPPNGRPVLGPHLRFRLPDGDGGIQQRDLEVLGSCTVASDGEHLYVGSRTSSIVYRVPIDEHGDVIPGEPAELIAVFEPWCVERGRSGDMFDMVFDAEGNLYVAMARAGRVWRITPDPAKPFYGNDQSDRPTSAPPFVDLAALTGKRSSAADLAIDDERGWLYICSRNNDVGAGPVDGTVYRVDLP